MLLEEATSSAEPAPTLRDYFEVLKRRKWIILLFICVVVGAGLAYTYTRTPIYESEAQVLVEPFSLEAENAGPPEEVNMETEALVATSPSVSEVAADELGDVDPRTLADSLSVSIAPDTSVLIFRYANRDPEEARHRAQALADAYVEHRAEQAQDRLETVAASIQSQVDVLQQQLDDVRAEIATATDAELITALRDEASSLSQQIVFERVKLFELASPSTLDVGRVLFEAEVPATPSSPTPVTNALIALLVGISGGIGIAFLRERLDERLSGRTDLESAAKAPVLTMIPRVATWKHAHLPYLVTEEEPHSIASEAYRTLRTAVLFAASQQKIQVLMIASANEREGKTVTSANLAVVLGQTGKSVVVVPGDLRKPRLQEFFRVRPHKGMSNVLAGEVPLSQVLQPVGPSPGTVRLLPSGPVPGNPAELLGSDAMMDLFRELRESFDFVIVDSAPVLAVADAMIVAPMCDAVLIVTDAAKTRRGAVHQARLQLDQVNARVIGAILQNFDPKAHSYASGTYAYNGDVDEIDYTRLEEPSDRRKLRIPRRERQKG